MMSFNFKDFDPPSPLCHHYILENNIILTSIKIYYLKWGSSKAEANHVINIKSHDRIKSRVNVIR